MWCVVGCYTKDCGLLLGLFLLSGLVSAFIDLLFVILVAPNSHHPGRCIPPDIFFFSVDVIRPYLAYPYNSSSLNLSPPSPPPFIQGALQRNVSFTIFTRRPCCGIYFLSYCLWSSHSHFELEKTKIPEYTRAILSISKRHGLSPLHLKKGGRLES